MVYDVQQNPDHLGNFIVSLGFDIELSLSQLSVFSLKHPPALRLTTNVLAFLFPGRGLGLSLSP